MPPACLIQKAQVVVAAAAADRGNCGLGCCTCRTQVRHEGEGWAGAECGVEMGRSSVSVREGTKGSGGQELSVVWRRMDRSSVWCEIRMAGDQWGVIGGVAGG
jgi:hypothetical protein